SDCPRCVPQPRPAGRSSGWALFFQGLAPPSRSPDAVGGESRERVGQFAPAATDGFHVHARDQGKPPIAAMTDPQRLQANIPSAVILVQAAEKEVHQAMDLAIRMILHLTIGAATMMELCSCHEAPHFPYTR